MIALLSTDTSDPRWGIGYAIAAYVVIFATLFGYLGYLHASHRRLRKRIESLEREMPSGPES